MEDKAIYMLKKVHEGICRNHSGGRGASFGTKNPKARMLLANYEKRYPRLCKEV